MEYRRVEQDFVHGFLERSGEEAARDYVRFRYSDPSWAGRYQLLAAESMVWRGTYQDALSLIGEDSPELSRDDQIRRLTVQAVALLRLQHSAAAARDLENAESLCRGTASAACGAVLRTRGIFAVSRGEISEAKQWFIETLAFARERHDPLLATTALINLSYIALQGEHYDQAVEWAQEANRSATKIGAEGLMEGLSGNLGWAYFRLGDRERALELFAAAEKSARSLGNIRDEVKWLTTSGYAHESLGDYALAAESYRRALVGGRAIGSHEDIVNALEDLAHVSVQAGRLREAERSIREAEPLIRANHLDRIDLTLARAGLAAARRQDQEAESLFRSVITDPVSQTSMRLGAEHQLARLYEREGRRDQAQSMYETALHTFESARAQIRNEDSRLPFFANATPIYDDYIHLLVTEGHTDEALAAADRSRARTLEQGLGLTAGDRPSGAAALRPQAVAARDGATLLFYWLGDRQSYLWAVTAKKTAVFTLPPKAEIARLAESYRNALLGPLDPLEDSNGAGFALYDILVAPAAGLLPANGKVVVLCDGALSRLNFETLPVPGRHPHYWIEDANVVSAPSLLMLAAAQSDGGSAGRLLLIGDAVSPGPDYPGLPNSDTEMREVRRHFAPEEEALLAGVKATPAQYFAHSPQRFAYIHFVAHGVASRTDPLDSAIILSRTGEEKDSFKLYARDIIRHPIDARLVTISSCYGSGTRAYAGEGLVGLSWAFLRAGAHNVIGALWEVSDVSTPRLMDELYDGLTAGMPPGAALRRAQLALLHAHGAYSRPFYWGPFQLYTGR